jgi:hypothetical protein
MTKVTAETGQDIDPFSTICAELIGSDTCAALGLIAKSGAPVLALCRKLIEAGHDPSMPLEAYRGETLCLRVRSIREAATLRMDTDRAGRPVFKREKTTARASSVEFQREAAE